MAIEIIQETTAWKINGILISLHVEKALLIFVAHTKPRDYAAVVHGEERDCYNLAREFAARVREMAEGGE